MEQQLPPSLLASLENVKGFDLSAFTIAHKTQNQISSVRINPAKIFDINKSVLNVDSKVLWSSKGFYLKERPSFTIDPFFHAGAYYVQEASSMFLEEVLKQSCDLNASLKLLDLCAAPGGKSTLLQSLISNESLLVCNEVIKTRVNVLSENITKWGAVNTVVTNNDPKDFQRLPEYFDVIIADAPCSGSGLFRKDPDAINEWSVDNVVLCSQRQQRILADIIPALKPGGLLIYSTCSYSESENETIADWLLNENEFETVQIKLDDDWGIVETQSVNKKAFGYRFYPDKIKGEGFFIAAFRKKGDYNNSEKIKTKSRQELISKSQLQYLNNWIQDTNTMAFFKWKDDIIAFPESLLNEISILQSALYIKKAGVNIGSIIREELIPSHELAVSTLIKKDIHSVSWELESALQYLRHQTIPETILERGWLMVKFGGLSLGFLKAMPNRINNYYPREWRILKK